MKIYILLYILLDLYESNNSTHPSVERVQHGVSGSVGDTARTMCLTTTAEVQTLATKGSLVDLSIIQAAERHAVVFQLKI